jgi:hypothetical protein
MTDKLSVVDARSLQYFHEKKGDMTCLANFDELRPILQRDYPEVLAALLQVEVANRTLDAVVKQMVGRVEEDGE